MADLMQQISDLIGPIKFESNRRHIVPAIAGIIIRYRVTNKVPFVDDKVAEKAIRYGKTDMIYFIVSKI